MLITVTAGVTGTPPTIAWSGMSAATWSGEIAGPAVNDPVPELPRNRQLTRS